MGDNQENLSPAPKKKKTDYMHWRVSEKARSDFDNLKVQGYWWDKDDVEFADYLIKLGMKLYAREVLPVEAGDQEKKRTDNEIGEPIRRAAIG